MYIKGKVVPVQNMKVKGRLRGKFLLFVKTILDRVIGQLRAGGHYTSREGSRI